jgi:hypothetical protein
MAASTQGAAAEAARSPRAEVMALRVRPFCFDYGTINALQQVAEFKPLLEGINMLSFVAHLRQQTIRGGGRPGRVSWQVWLQATRDLGLSEEQASIFWRGARAVEADKQKLSQQTVDLFADQDSVPLTRLGALLFYSSVIPRPITREIDAAWLDPPTSATVVEDVPQLLSTLAPRASQTTVIDLQGGEVAEHISIEGGNISDVAAAAATNMQKILGTNGKNKTGTAGSYIATVRKVPALIEYNSTFVMKILVVSLGLATRQSIVCADALPPWPPRPRSDSSTRQNAAENIAWNDVLIPVSCIEHLRFLFELPDVPLTLGWRTVELEENSSEPCVEFSDAVTYLCDLKGIAMGSFPIQSANLPWVHMRSIAGTRIVRALLPMRWEVSALVRSTMIKRLERSDVLDLDIRGCKDCRLDFIPQVTARLRNVIIGQCSGCTVFIGACESLTLTTSERITILAATRADVRITNCFDCQVHILCNERPTVFGDNRLVYMAPAGYYFSDLEKVLKAHGIRLDCNRWNHPFDFERNGAPHPSAVALLPPSAYWPPVLLWSGAKDLRSSPWPVEKEYVEAYERRLAGLDRLRRSVSERLADRKDAIAQLQDLVHRRFREWLGTSNCMRQVRDLLRMESGDTSAQVSRTSVGSALQE